MFSQSKLGGETKSSVTSMFTLVLFAASLLWGREFGNLGLSNAAPLSTFTLATLRDAAPDDQPHCSCPNARGLLDILWSCLATIFLCTWVSVHPNLPPPDENGLRTFLRKLKMMLSTLVGPEMLLLFSVRQWLAAREEVKRYKSQEWTLTHGHFLTMGGFVLMKDQKDMGTISSDLFQKLYESGDIVFPSISKREIEDRNKGDFMSKGIVVLQTLWFTIQCIARGVQGLALTELEVFTLAFCTLNAATYFFWWNKPLDIQCRVHVYLKAGSDYEHPLPPGPDIEDIPAAATETHDSTAPVVPLEGELGDEQPSYSSFLRLWITFLAAIEPIPIVLRPFAWAITQIWCRTVEFHTSLPRKTGGIILFVIFLIPLTILVSVALLLYSTTQLIGALEEQVGARASPLPVGQNRVRTFYCLPLRNTLAMPLITLFTVAAFVFGGIHYIAWDFRFPNHTERLLWRSSSVTLTALPVVYMSIGFIMGILQRYLRRGPPQVQEISWTSCLGNYLFAFYYFISLLCVIIMKHLLPLVYVAVRFILLVESFIALRDLSPSTLLGVDWLNFVPHL